VSDSASALSGEDRLIAQLFKPMATHPGALALEDDAAFFSPPAGHDLVLTKDALVAGVHFFADDPAGAIARKALRVNLSDLAAKGADPAGFLLTLALPAETSASWLEEFARALDADATHYRCPLLGGDTVRMPGPLTLSITALGSVPAGRMVRRRGAQVGDRVFVSGTIGDAALGLLLRKGESARSFSNVHADAHKYLRDRYLVPRPRNAIAHALRDHASAAMDISDGLVGDLAKLCRVSQVSADLRVAGVPLSEGARAMLARDQSLIETVLTGGDDFEILCTVPGSMTAAWIGAAAAAGVVVTDIGQITEGGRSPRWVDDDGRPRAFARPAFSHFS
jgi:thiamine-monophosphate kinase